MKRKESMHNIKKAIKPQQKRGRKEKRDREELQKQPENNKMAVSTHIYQ